MPGRGQDRRADPPAEDEGGERDEDERAEASVAPGERRDLFLLLLDLRLGGAGLLGVLDLHVGVDVGGVDLCDRVARGLGLLAVEALGLVDACAHLDVDRSVCWRGRPCPWTRAKPSGSRGSGAHESAVAEDEDDILVGASFGVGAAPRGPPSIRSAWSQSSDKPRNSAKAAPVHPREAKIAGRGRAGPPVKRTPVGTCISANSGSLVLAQG